MVRSSVNSFMLQWLVFVLGLTACTRGYSQDDRGGAFVDSSANGKVSIPIPVMEAEQRPVFPGGDDAIYKFISEHVRYPGHSQGIVFVDYTIEKDGRISNVKVRRADPPNDPLMEKEAVRVVELLPAYEQPGRKMNGEPVRVTFTLPMRFTATRTSASPSQ